MWRVDKWATKAKAFAQAESGAVTVDFVVLTAMIVGLGIAVVLVIAPGLNPVAAKIEPAMTTAPGLGASLITSP